MELWKGNHFFQCRTLAFWKITFFAIINCTTREGHDVFTCKMSKTSHGIIFTHYDFIACTKFLQCYTLFTFVVLFTHSKVSSVTFYSFHFCIHLYTDREWRPVKSTGWPVTATDEHKLMSTICKDTIWSLHLCWLIAVNSENIMQSLHFDKNHRHSIEVFCIITVRKKVKGCRK